MTHNSFIFLQGRGSFVTIWEHQNNQGLMFADFIQSPIAYLSVVQDGPALDKFARMQQAGLSSLNTAKEALCFRKYSA